MNIFTITISLLCLAKAGDIGSDTVKVQENRIAPQAETGIGESEAGRKYAVTTLSADYLREAPDFTAELGNQVLMGTPVEILGEDGYWRKVRTPDPYTAWCVDLGLKEMSADELEEYIRAEKLICTADYSTVLKSPDRRKREKICDIVSGDLLLCHSSKCGVDCDGKTRKALRKTRGCYKVTLPSGETGYVPADDVELFSRWVSGTDATARNIINTAVNFLGVPYFWGGTSIKGVDCSGLVKMVWFLNGVLLPRNASQQARTGKAVNIPEEPLQKGDLIFFGSPEVTGPDGETVSPEKISHVGIYIGQGKFIHASRIVRINSLIQGEPDYYDLSWKMFKARRIIGCGEDEGIIRISDSPFYFHQK